VIFLDTAHFSLRQLRQEISRAFANPQRDPRSALSSCARAMTMIWDKSTARAVLAWE